MHTKTTDKIQPPFMIKILIKIDIERTYLNIIKLKSFYIVKEIIDKMKKTYRMGENICK